MAEIPVKPPWVRDLPDEPATEPTSTQAAPAPIERDTHGRWKPGVSGNPRGRARSRSRELIARGIDDVIAVLQSAALEGDVAAAALLFSRGLPAVRPEFEPVEFELDTNAPVSTQCKAILQAAADGKISLDKAERFIKLVGNIKDLVDVEAVLDELERLRRRGKTNTSLPAGHVMQTEIKVINGTPTVVIPEDMN